MERNQRCFCGSGKKYKNCHIRINGESKLAKIYQGNHNFDLACKEMNIQNQCIQDCFECCKDIFFISENEFLLILEKLIYEKADISFYLEKAEKIQNAVVKIYPELMTQLKTVSTNNKIDLLIKSSCDGLVNEELPPCIFLNERNKCDIYEIRPGICRMYGSTNTCRKLNNPDLQISACTQMEIEQDVILGPKGKKIIKRPYPIFYWFTHFLNDDCYAETIKRMATIKSLSENDYFKLHIKK